MAQTRGKYEEKCEHLGILSSSLSYFYMLYNKRVQICINFPETNGSVTIYMFAKI